MRGSLLGLLVLVGNVGVGGAVLAAELPKTVAESTNFTATSRHADVLAFCDQLAKESPLIRLGEMGVTNEGRRLPLVIVADPPVANAEEARKSGKLIFFAMGNIHAGEVDGKEALLMLAREFGERQHKAWLKDVVFVFAPIFNADGNDKMGKNRPSQGGPPEVGMRTNAQELDLNRDFVKLESPEVRSLVRLFNEWDPAVFIDMHTTNGSYHRYAITYEGGSCPAGDARVVTFVRDQLFPEVGRRMEKATGYHSYFYGNFSPDRTLWQTVPPTPRYGIHYFGLRNRIGILSESYNYASFKERILAGKAFVENIASFVADNRSAIESLLKDARAATIAAGQAPKETDHVVLRSEPTTIGRPVKLLGYEEAIIQGRRRPTEQVKEYEVTYEGGTKPTLSVRLPYAYLVPASFGKVVDLLKLHGVAVGTLQQPTTLDVEAYRITKVTRTAAFQKHQPVVLDAMAIPEKRSVEAGTFIVRTAQPLGSLAAYLLEPQSADGMATWNFFDDVIKEGELFPVVRVLSQLEAK